MKTFYRVVIICIIGTYLVILAGAVVRGTGSGLGCPDWPRCFGQWVPPVDITELPENYKEIYKISGKTIADFDPFKTWIEYVNRLLGVVLGFLIIILFGLSFGLKRYERNIHWYCGGLLFLIIVQGGIGALVVSTHLKPYIITVHMFLAVVLLFGLLYLKKYCSDLMNKGIDLPFDAKGYAMAKVLVAVTFFQVLLGTQVRQKVDHLIRDTQEAVPETVISQLGFVFYFHRTFSILIVAIFLYFLYYFHRIKFNRSAFFYTFMAFLCICGNVFSGIMLNYFQFPAAAQPPHLFFGVLGLGFIYSLVLDLKGNIIDE